MAGRVVVPSTPGCISTTSALRDLLCLCRTERARPLALPLTLETLRTKTTSCTIDKTQNNWRQPRIKHGEITNAHAGECNLDVNRRGHLLVSPAGEDGTIAPPGRCTNRRCSFFHDTRHRCTRLICPKKRPRGASHQLCLNPDAVPDDKLPDLVSPASLIVPKAVIRTAPTRHAYTSLLSRSLVRAQALSLPKTFPRLSQCHLTFLLHASL